MALTVWDDRYELGMPEIDDHHQKLVELLNRTYEMLLFSTEKEAIQAILAELTNYTEYHFHAEERTMKEVRFRGHKVHIANHNNFREQIAVLNKKYLSASAHVNADIVLFLWDWLNRHILDDDKKLSACLART